METRLRRELSTSHAVVIGLGSMLGAGVFVAFAPAAAAAGSGLLVGLMIAAAVAYANATSSAQLAARYPRSGGTYVYASERLGAPWGVIAGWAFIAGKLASCAAIALAFGRYLAPGAVELAAVVAVVALTAVNYTGVRRSARLTYVLVAGVLAALALVVAGSLASDPRALAWGKVDALGVLRAAAILFFAFAGYARIATLGEEVIEPERTIPRAIPLALAITVVVYALVGVAVLLALGPSRLAASQAPLALAVAHLPGLVGFVRAGAVLATLGVLVALIAGVGRTVFALAADGYLPQPLASVHPRYRVPHRAVVVVGLVVIALVLATGVAGAIEFSSFLVLVYYALTNAAALTLTRDERRRPRPLAAFGLLGCVVLAFSLPVATVLAGLVVLALGLVVFARRR